MGKVPPDKKINGLIFRELLKRGYSLDGKTRVWNVADSKLWYLTPEQAQAFLDLEKSEDYQKRVIQKEIKLVNDNIKEILNKVGKDPLNIIDIGCGDGRKAELFIKYLKGKVKLKYCPIDISNYMVEKSLTRMKKLGVGKVVKFDWNISDFENLDNVASLLRDVEYKKNFMLLLGNTLGNFEIHELLYAIRTSMKSGDFLLIGNGLDHQDEEEILKSYDNSDTDFWLKKIPMQLGLEEGEFKFGARFLNSRVEVYYTILVDRIVPFQEKTVYFKKGDQILTGISYKYNKELFKNFLDMYFEGVEIFVSSDGSYVLALCKK